MQDELIQKNNNNEFHIKVPSPKVRINEMTAFGVVKIIFSNEMYVPSPHNEKSDAEKNQTRNLMTSEDPLEMIK